MYTALKVTHLFSIESKNKYFFFRKATLQFNLSISNTMMGAKNKFLSEARNIVDNVMLSIELHSESFLLAVYYIKRTNVYVFIQYYVRPWPDWPDSMVKNVKPAHSPMDKMKCKLALRRVNLFALSKNNLRNGNMRFKKYINRKSMKKVNNIEYSYYYCHRSFYPRISGEVRKLIRKVKEA
ncbi:Uncharacterized protein FWK35_00000374 [Aphis craccivora]|uniref:Uncharacterized protein n=1 Tax=Aphis craccivora TaxID=307492 RepID=A0A6G0ZL11_APHCR|nr:Uncharacterized protein FWK35_00000374 [Aphis craccivora]